MRRKERDVVWAEECQARERKRREQEKAEREKEREYFLEKKERLERKLGRYKSEIVSALEEPYLSDEERDCMVLLFHEIFRIKEELRKADSTLLRLEREDAQANEEE